MGAPLDYRDINGFDEADSVTDAMLAGRGLSETSSWLLAHSHG